MIPLYYKLARDRIQLQIDRIVFWAFANPRDFGYALTIMLLLLFLGFAASVKTHYEEKYTAMLVQRDAAIQQYMTTKASLDVAQQTLLINAEVDQRFAELYTPLTSTYFPIALKNQKGLTTPRLGVTHQVPDAVIAALYNQILTHHNSLVGKFQDCDLPVPPSYVEYASAGPVMKQTLYITYTASFLEQVDSCVKK